MRVATIDDPRYFMEPRLSLAWRFEYIDGGVVACAWNHDDPPASAYFRSGLLRASILVKENATGRMVMLAECPGDDFIEVRWIRMHGTPAGLSAYLQKLNVDEVKIRGRIHGIILVSRVERMTVMIDGMTRSQPNIQEDAVWNPADSSLSSASPSRSHLSPSGPH